MGGPAAYLARIELRRRWVATLVVALVFGFAAGTAMTAWAAAPRGPEALARFDEEFENADGSVFLFDPTALGSVLAEAETAGAERAATVVFVTLLAAADGGVRPLGGTLASPAIPTSNARRWSRGRLPDPAEPFEMALNEAAARHLDLEPGERIDLGILSAEQTDTLDGSQPPEHGDEPSPSPASSGSRRTWSSRTTPSPARSTPTRARRRMWSPALWDRYDGDLANYGAGVIVQAPDGEEVAPIVERMAAPFEARPSSRPSRRTRRSCPRSARA